ncbi:hypothetical protein C7S20_19425 [Christiangramia fulva]|uniref:Uncharacterized protein n=1 Tax=Christiangramia fulva TaxID=2126553 RepID=A0A2R3ZAG0_9FLAO|nr:hypothetical protein [Christiangramia fulva]AVR47247.1 hypothetical protein C7S20_19425 [Christiangramia fulva]
MFDDHAKIDEPTEEVRKKEVEKKQKLLGSKKVHKGHTLYEINLKEHTIVEATFEKEVADYEKEAKPVKKQLGIVQFKDGHRKVMIDNFDRISKKVIKKPNCIYISALNKKNLKKKLIQRGVIKIVKK